jgi:hypothetical protein
LALAVPKNGRWVKSIALKGFGLRERSDCKFMQLKAGDFIRELKITFSDEGVTSLFVKTNEGYTL